MDAKLKFYRGLVELLEGHVDEDRRPRRAGREFHGAAFLSKILAQAARSAQPPPSRRCEVRVFCSVIHLSPAIVFLLAQNDLRAQLSLDIQFCKTSSSAVEGFKRATAEKCPALVTVTDGTAGLLSQSPSDFWQFMEVPSVSLRLASTGEVGDFRTTDLTRLQYKVANHPTDLSIFQKFTERHLSKFERPAELLLIDEPPESVESIAQAKGGQLLLINPHMAHWLEASVDGLKPLSVLGGWRAIENRFIFGNSFFAALVDARKDPVAKWLYLYLKDKFDNLRGAKSDFVTNTRIGKEGFAEAVRTEYFNL